MAEAGGQMEPGRSLIDELNDKWVRRAVKEYAKALLANDTLLTAESLLALITARIDLDTTIRDVAFRRLEAAIKKEGAS